MKPLEPSISAAFLRGPKARMPAASRLSTSPFTSGASGPTTTRSIFWATANWVSASISSAPIATHSASDAIPALPGAQ